MKYTPRFGRVFLLLAGWLGVAGACGPVMAAQPPAVLNYQGVLRDAEGAPRDGRFDMVFRFFDAAALGNEILVDEHLSIGTGAVTAARGLFNVALGGGSVMDGRAALPNDPYTSLSQVFRDFSTVYMEVQVSGETLAPRIQVVAAAYALNADHLDGKDGAQYLDTSATAQVKIGNLTVGDLTASGNDVRFGTGARATATAMSLSLTAGDLDTDDLLLNAGNSQADGALEIFGAGQMVLRSGNGNFSFNHGTGATLASLQASGDLQVSGGLAVSGQVSIAGGAPAAGRVLTSSATGLASWQDLPAAQTNQLRLLADRLGGPDPSTFPFAQLRSFNCGGGNTATLSFTAGGVSLGSVAAFVGTDRISAPYEYLIAIERPDTALVPEAQIGLDGRLTLQRAGGTTTFSGLITEFGLAGRAGGVATYVARLEPRLVRLARSSGYRTWRSMKASDILTTLVSEAGYTPIVDPTAIQYDWEIQYEESPLDLFDRLAESEGLHYHFREAAATESLAVRSSNAGFALVPGSFNYYGDLQDPGTGEEFIATFHARTRQFTGTATAGGWNYLTKSILQSTVTVPGGTGEFRESFADVTSGALATARAQTAAQREQVRRFEHSGSGNVASLKAGHVFTLNDLAPAGFGGSYVVTEIRHYAASDPAQSCVSYGNAFSALPSAVEYRPPRRTHPPNVRGPVSALVTDINDPDGLDRVRVKFGGDLTGIEQSAWARVAKPEPGRRLMPDVDDEVLVDFVRGDPRVPVVVGTLYNGVDTPPDGGEIRLVDVMPPLGCPPPCPQAIRFYDDNSATNESLSWDDAADRFEFTNDLSAGGQLALGGGAIVMDEDGPEGSQFIHFFDGVSPTDESLSWNEAADRFELTNDLRLSGGLEAAGEIKGGGNLTLGGGLNVAGVIQGGSTLTVPGPIVLNGAILSQASGVFQVAGDLQVIGGDISASTLNVAATGTLDLSSTETRVRSTNLVRAMIDSDNNSTLSTADWYHDGSFTAASKLAEIGESGNLRIRGTLSQSVSFDLAESFRASEPVEAGDLVSLDPRAAGSVRLTDGAGDPLVIGVVSEKPGMLLGGAPFDPVSLKSVWGDDVGALYEKDRARLRERVLAGHEELRGMLADGEVPEEASEGEESGETAASRQELDARIESESLETFYRERFAPVALAGRVPVKVDASYGAVKPGDPLTPSPVPGVAMKATGPGPIVGTALEGLSAGRGKVLALIHRGQSGVPAGKNTPAGNDTPPGADIDRAADPGAPDLAAQGSAPSPASQATRDAGEQVPFSIRRADGAERGAGAEVFRVDGEGNVYARGAFHPAAMDLAEYFPVSEPAAVGDVLVVHAGRPGRHGLARRAHDPAVVGIVSGEPGVILGGGITRISAADSGLAAELEEARWLKDAEREAALWAALRARFQETHAPIALSGTVLCKVDAGYGAIVPGDLLTTSPTAGHAMRADHPLPGTIVGKALEPLGEGMGLIKVLVMLR